MRHMWWAIIALMMFSASCASKEIHVTLEKDVDNSFDIPMSYSHQFSSDTETLISIPHGYNISDTLTVNFQESTQRFGDFDTADSFITVLLGEDSDNRKYAFFDTDNDEDLSDETPEYFTASEINSNGKISQQYKVDGKIVVEYFDGEKNVSDTFGLSILQHIRTRTMTLYAVFNINKGTVTIDGNSFSLALINDMSVKFDEYSEIWVDSNQNTLYDKHDYRGLLKYSPPFGQTSYTVTDFGTFGEKVTLTKSDLPSMGIGLPSPDFETLSLNGETINLQKVRGKHALLFFWDTTCYPSKGMIPYVEKVREQIGSDTIEIISLCKGNRDDILELTEKMNWIKIQLDQTGTSILDLYRIGGTPELFLVDNEGILIAHSPLLFGSDLVQSVRGFIDVPDSH